MKTFFLEYTWFSSVVIFFICVILYCMNRGYYFVISYIFSFVPWWCVSWSRCLFDPFWLATMSSPWCNYRRFCCYWSWKDLTFCCTWWEWSSLFITMRLSFASWWSCVVECTCFLPMDYLYQTYCISPICVCNCNESNGVFGWIYFWLRSMACDEKYCMNHSSIITRSYYVW